MNPRTAGAGTAAMGTMSRRKWEQSIRQHRTRTRRGCGASPLETLGNERQQSLTQSGCHNSASAGSDSERRTRFVCRHKRRTKAGRAVSLRSWPTMASLITHPAVPIAIATIVGRKIIPTPLLLMGVVFSMLPDLDGITFRLGIPYGSPLGHRGFSHSLAVAALCAIVLVPIARALKASGPNTLWFLFVSMASHGVLDAFTNKGHGVAFFWPVSTERFFFGFRPIEASPVSVKRFLSGRGIDILQSELLWVWAPLILLAVLCYCVRRVSARADRA